MALLAIQDALECPSFECADIEAGRSLIHPGGIADNIDQAVERVQAAKQIIVFTIAAREKAGEILEADGP